MSQPTGINNGFRFDPFSLDRDTGDLYKDGVVNTRLRRQSLVVLEMLLERAQQRVSREDLVAAVWGAGTEPDGGLKGIVSELRAILADPSTEAIEILRSKGGY